MMISVPGGINVINIDQSARLKRDREKTIAGRAGMEQGSLPRVGDCRAPSGPLWWAWMQRQSVGCGGDGGEEEGRGRKMMHFRPRGTDLGGQGFEKLEKKGKKTKGEREQGSIELGNINFASPPKTFT